MVYGIELHENNWLPYNKPNFDQLAKNFLANDSMESEVNFTKLETDPLKWPREITTTNGKFRMKSLYKMSWEDDEIYIDATYPAQKWTDGVVNFVILGNFSQSFIRHLKLVFIYIQNRSCIKFVQHENLSCGNPVQLLRIFPSFYCRATVGFNGLNTRMEILEPACTSFSDLAHLTMHVLGFDHEFHRPESDTFVELTKSFPENKHWLFKPAMHEATKRYMPYNPHSILHMDSFKYAVLALRYQPDKVQCPLCKYGLIRKGNDLHPLDMNNLNIFYDCGHPDCMNEMSTEACDEAGLGLHESNYSSRLYIAAKARCAERHPSLLTCARTCGFCYMKGKEGSPMKKLIEKPSS